VARFYVAAHGLVHREGLYLATRRSAINTYMPGLWDIPGGTVHEGETLPQALEREMCEETSLKVNIGRILYAHTNVTNPTRATVQCVYGCEYVDGDVRLNPAEHDAFAWLSLADLASLNTLAFLRATLNEDHLLNARVGPT
jgi:8-oxo-dGTP diphosphatase